MLPDRAAIRHIAPPGGAHFHDLVRSGAENDTRSFEIMKRGRLGGGGRWRD
jgi:hypothetical protein